jgi:hypothetical protein
MANKMKKTQKEMYNELLALPNLTEEQKAFLKGRIEQLEKKTVNKKVSENAERNANLMVAIANYMENGVKYPTAKIMKEVDELSVIDPLSNQFVTYLMGQLIKQGTVQKEIIKGKVHYSLTENE